MKNSAAQEEGLLSQYLPRNSALAVGGGAGYRTAMTDATIDITITALGHLGDGLASGPRGSLFVPGGLPGDVLRVKAQGDRASILEILTRSPARVEPTCRHFEACGGCSLQHMAEPEYLAFKRDQVVRALEDRGIEVPVDEVIPSAPGSRRRAVLTAVRAGHKLLLGYHERASNRLVDITECPVLDPKIVAAVPGLKRLAEVLMPRKGELRLTVLATQAGLDVALANVAPGIEKKLVQLSGLTADLGLARLSVDGEIILEARAPALPMGKVAAVPAPGGFTQATAEAEAHLATLVLAALGKSKKAADLFAGIGTFTFRMAETMSVHAVEGEAAAVAALDRASRQPAGLRQITFERRDLFRRPLMAAELAGFDAVTFDPPRTGAQAQAEQLALSKVKRIAAVSCNPATLARDLRILIDGGFKVTRVTPVDQFLYSPHVEVVAALERA